MGQFKYKATLTFQLPKVEVDKKSLKTERLKLRKRLIQSHQAGMTGFEMGLKEWLNVTMMTPAWQWPEGPKRDIYESGDLMRSLKTKTKYAQTKAVTEVIYTSPYAALMYYGGLIQPYGNQNANSVMIPGRPWVEAALNGTYGFEKAPIASWYEGMFNQRWEQG
jgi:hypothetical protein